MSIQSKSVGTQPASAFRAGLFHRACVVLVVLAAFVALWVLVQPTGKFPLNDDWQYAHVAKKFAETGSFRVDVPVAPTLVLQSAAGAAVIKAWGFSHESLRILTVVMAGILVLLLDGLLALAGTRLRFRLLAIAVLVVNPLFLHLLFSFMTEFYGLAIAFFGVWLWYRALAAEESGFARRALMGRLLASMVIATVFWVRQFSVLVFPAVLLARQFALHGWEGWRGTAARMIRTSWRESLVFVIPILLYFPWSRATGNFNPAFSMPLSKVLLRPAPGFWLTQTPIFVFYMTAFFLPVLLVIGISRWRSVWLESPRARLQATWGVGVLTAIAVLAALLGDRPYSNHHLLHPVFPFLGNVMLPFGLGPLTLSDVYMEIPKVIPGSSLVFWITLEILIIAASWTWLVLGQEAAQKRSAMIGSSSLRRQLVLFGGIFAVLSLFLAVQAYLSGLFERYHFSSMLGVLLSVVLLLDRLDLGEVRKSVVLAAAVVWAVLGGLSIVAEHDYFRWNEVRWKLLGQATLEGIPPREIDGGWEVNGWLAYEEGRPNRDDPACNPSVAWFCQSRPYFIGLNVPPGGQVILRERVGTWLGNFPDMMLIRRP